MRTLFTPCLLLILAGAPAAADAQGILRSRQAPERPPTTEAGCTLDLVKASGQTRKIRNRAERDAREAWERNVRRMYGPAFARWGNSARHTRLLECKTSDRGLIEKHWCWAAATPCAG